MSICFNFIFKMKTIKIFSVFFLLTMGSIFSFVKSQNTVPKGDASIFPPEIENPECLGINKEPAHATLMPYLNLEEALVVNRHASSYCRSLNGNWKFNWVAWPNQRPVDFYKQDFDVSGWKEIPVPSNWQVQGYGTPYYRNLGYTFQVDFPHVMSEPPKNFTAFEERNPVGSYRRDFDVPANWDGRLIFITFDGVDAGFFLWINGQKVGYSTNSRNAAEFDITKYLKSGKNTVSAEVYRYCSGSYLEDQDMWRLSGIFRNVTIWSAPQTHVRDFFIQTDLDKDYKNANVSVLAKVKNYSSNLSPAHKISASLYNGNKVVDGVRTTAIVPALKAGEESIISLKYVVTNPEKWTAETPKLYTTVLNLQDEKGIIETLSSRTGFRKIEIKGRQFLVNGVPLKLKGANRHESWPETGHYVSEAQMIKDLEVLKQGNCNHVRTCHYSDDPRWYELCDEWGIWLVAEANLECHGLYGKLDDEPRIKAAMIDRNVANVESFKNHPSIIIWSLGNECGYIGSNFVAALNAIKTIDPARPTQYEPFGISKKNPADLDSRMYPSTNEIEQIAKDTSYTKPFYMCEYAHAMFNSMGALNDYNLIIDKYPALLGGAIWEWHDQALWNRRDPKHPILAYGGGFGEFPNDKFFIHKGVVTADRSPKPHFPEMKRVYQWIGIQAADSALRSFKIRNKYQFISLDGFDASWTVSENGVEIAHGTLALPSIAPFEEVNCTIPWKVENAKPTTEYFLRVSFVQNRDQPWAKRGFEVAAAQFILPITAVANVEKVTKNPNIRMTESAHDVTLKGEGFSVVFDKDSATFSNISSNGSNILQVGGGPKLHLTRAAHQNDDGWADREWDAVGLKKLKWTVLSVKAKKSSNASVDIFASLKGEGFNGFVVNHEVTYTVFSKGSIVVKNNVSSNKPELPLARMGVRLLLQNQFDQFSYLGRGPMENYSDRKQGSDIGLYSSSIAQQLTPYEKPMECGNHEDVRWATVINNVGYGLTVLAGAQPIQVSGLPYTDEQMEPIAYRIDLPKSQSTVLIISCQTTGVGSNSCGPKPIESCIVRAVPTTFTYTLQVK